MSAIKAVQLILLRFNVSLIVVNLQAEEIVAWRT
jgi:hypothetical protein